MSETAKAKVSRSRRSLFKAVGITAGALAAIAVPRKAANAQWWCWWCGSGGSGGGSGSVCFVRDTPILTEDGYRPVESLTVGDRIKAHFAGMAPIKDITSFTLERTGPKGTWEGPSRPVRVKAGPSASTPRPRTSSSPRRTRSSPTAS